MCIIFLGGAGDVGSALHYISATGRGYRCKVVVEKFVVLELEGVLTLELCQVKETLGR